MRRRHSWLTSGYLWKCVAVEADCSGPRIYGDPRPTPIQRQATARFQTESVDASTPESPVAATESRPRRGDDLSAAHGDV
eukprot:454-Eustigmatos_ZCMA.PRE.1